MRNVLQGIHGSIDSWGISSSYLCCTLIKLFWCIIFTHIMYLSIYREYENVGTRKPWIQVKLVCIKRLSENVVVVVVLYLTIITKPLSLDYLSYVYSAFSCVTIKNAYSFWRIKILISLLKTNFKYVSY